MATNWLSSLATAIVSGGSTTASSVGTAISGWFASKYSSITSTLQDLQNAGPTASPAQLNNLLSELNLEFAQVHGLPGVEFTFETTLAGLVGKSDGASVELWSQTCASAISTLTNASSAL